MTCSTNRKRPGSPCTLNSVPGPRCRPEALTWCVRRSQAAEGSVWGTGVRRLATARLPPAPALHDAQLGLVPAGQHALSALVHRAESPLPEPLVGPLAATDLEALVLGQVRPRLAQHGRPPALRPGAHRAPPGY